MIDGYKELTPVIYGENAIKYLYTEQKKAEGEICFLLHWHDRMELTYVTEGTLRFVTEGEEFLVSAGELAVADRGRCMAVLQCRKRSAIIRSCLMWSGFIMERQRLKNIYVPWEMEN